MTVSKLDRVANLMAERYGDLGKAAARRLASWLSGEVPFAYPEVLERHLADEHVDLLFDAFWQVLPFGTGGRRGRVGYGPNRINPTTLAMTVQGHCEFLRTAYPGRDDLEVVVANDVRVFQDISGTYRFLGSDHPLIGVSARSLAKLACEIYAGNGIRAYLTEPASDSAILATPELSFVISELGTVGGVNLSASHNPPDDNGVKVYDGFGSQPIAPADQELVDAMERATTIARVPFEQGLAEDRIRAIPGELHERYLQVYERLFAGMPAPTGEHPIVYTPLCGCGGSTAGDLLRRLGFPVLSPPEEAPSGAFAVIPFKAPNPEVPQATAPARRYADEHGAGIVLSSDPDADRIGLEIKLADGTWYHFDGNQIAAVLAWFLMLDPDGPQRRGLVIETLVTTKILGRVVSEAGDSWIVDDLLVGFKYVADVLKKLAADGHYGDVRCRPEQLVLAAEESHGVIVAPDIRDKDASPACMYLASLYQRLAARGETLLDYYVAILERLGAYDTVNRSIMMSGADGMIKKDRIMASLREDPPAELGGQRVQRMSDYWDEDAWGPFLSETDRLPRNVLQVFTEAFIITIRPSGTEPKLKIYCQLLPGGAAPTATGTALLADIRERADAAVRQVYRDLLARIGVTLDEPALKIPDIVDLERKLVFQQRTIPALRQRLESDGFADLDSVLAWLREESAAMTPGTDPLPAIEAAVADVLDRWQLGTSLAARLGSRVGAGAAGAQP